MTTMMNKESSTKIFNGKKSFIVTQVNDNGGGGSGGGSGDNRSFVIIRNGRNDSGGGGGASVDDRNQNATIDSSSVMMSSSNIITKNVAPAPAVSTRFPTTTTTTKTKIQQSSSQLSPLSPPPKYEPKYFCYKKWTLLSLIILYSIVLIIYCSFVQWFAEKEVAITNLPADIINPDDVESAKAEIIAVTLVSNVISIVIQFIGFVGIFRENFPLTAIYVGVNAIFTIFSFVRATKHSNIYWGLALPSAVIIVFTIVYLRDLHQIYQHFMMIVTTTSTNSNGNQLSSLSPTVLLPQQQQQQQLQLQLQRQKLQRQLQRSPSPSSASRSTQSKHQQQRIPSPAAKNIRQLQRFFSMPTPTMAAALSPTSYSPSSSITSLGTLNYGSSTILTTLTTLTSTVPTSAPITISSLGDSFNNRTNLNNIV